jgi:hypothetical protein
MLPDAARSVYRRRIEIEPGAGIVSAELEDHHHHFRVEIEHDGTTIVDARGTGIRAPWDTCDAGSRAVAAMTGLSIATACDPRSWGADRSAQCTHTADVALLAVRHAHDAALRYDVRIWPAARTHRLAILERDGHEVMRWELDGAVIAGPLPWDRLPLDRRSFLPWIRAHLDEPGIEQAMIMRRASSIAIGNAFDLDGFAVASDVHPADETCHTYRREVALTARRRTGTSRALQWE